MKNITFILLLVLFPITSLAQTFKWAKTGGQHTDDYADKIIVSDNHAYVGGYVNSNTYIENYFFSDGGIVLIKATKEGNILWIKRYADSEGRVTGMCSDQIGNIYMVVVSSDFTIGTTRYREASLKASTFIMKYTKDGDLIWIKPIVSHIFAGDTINNGIAIDSEDNLYITGYYDRQCYFDNILLTALNCGTFCYTDIYVAKLNSAGNVIWAKSYGSQFDDRCVGIGIDSNDNIYISSSVQRNVILENNNLQNEDEASMLIKFNKNGGLIWHRSSKGGYVEPYDLVVDNENNICITGVYGHNQGTRNFNGFFLAPSPLNGDRYSFLVKYGQNGEVKWLRSIPINILTNFESTIATNSNNDIYLTGFFGTNPNPFDLTLPTNGTLGSMFITKYNSIGYPQWCKKIIKQGNYPSNDIFLDIFVDKTNRLFLSGKYQSLSINFDGNIVNNRSGNDDYDLFFCELADLTTSSCPPKGITIQPSTTLCVGSTHTITSQYPYTAYAQEVVWLKNNLIHLRGAYPSIQVNQTGNYKMVVNPFTNCADTSNIVNITVVDYPLKNIEGKSIICEGENTVLSVENNPNYTYQWYANQQLINGANTYNITVSNPAEYTAHITNQNLCKTISNKIMLQIVPKQQDFLPDSLFFCKGSSISLAPQNLHGFWEYQWSNGQISPSIMVSEANSYMLTVSRNGCSYTDNVVVSFYDDFIPNVITPNGDGKNDTWVIFTSKEQKISVEIYNRSGKLVYSNPDYKNDWTGDNLPSDTYYYTLKNTTCQTNNKGVINLIR